MTPISLRPIDDNNWVVVDDFTVNTLYGPITVKSGSTTDLASVPRPLWAIIPRSGLHTPASVVHDYIYRNTSIRLSQRQADNIFLQLMLKDGVNKILAYTMWFGVRLFGHHSYKTR
ncbi:DUF1353 domain-containing protein [Aeromonas veronii]